MPTPRSSLPDALAGLSIAGLLLPEAVAYSGLAGLPPQAGVIALFAGLVCYGLLGRSRYAHRHGHLVLGGGAGIGDPRPGRRRSRHAHRLRLDTRGRHRRARSCSSGALRLGAMSSLIARPVLRGYSFGLALVIAVKQWPTLVQLPVHSGSFLPLLQELARHAGAWQLPSLGCGLAALAGLFLLERIPRVPGALVVIVASIAASGCARRARRGAHRPDPPGARRARVRAAAGRALAAADGVLAGADVHPVRRVLRLDPHLRAQAR